MTEYMRYRTFIANLETDAAEDDKMRILENRYLAEECDTWLSLVPWKDGCVALVRSRKHGKTPIDVGVTIRLEPTVMMTALAAALARPEMMNFARSILTGDDLDLYSVGMFTDGLKDVARNPFQDDAAEAARPAPIRKPPSLDIELWRRIPHAKRRDFIREMAMGVRRGIHPDDTVAELLTAA